MTVLRDERVVSRGEKALGIRHDAGLPAALEDRLCFRLELRIVDRVPVRAKGNDLARLGLVGKPFGEEVVRLLRLGLVGDAAVAGQSIPQEDRDEAERHH